MTSASIIDAANYIRTQTGAHSVVIAVSEDTLHIDLKFSYRGEPVRVLSAETWSIQGQDFRVVADRAIRNYQRMMD